MTILRLPILGHTPCAQGQNLRGQIRFGLLGQEEKTDGSGPENSAAFAAASGSTSAVHPGLPVHTRRPQKSTAPPICRTREPHSASSPQPAAPSPSSDAVSSAARTVAVPLHAAVSLLPIHETFFFHAAQSATRSARCLPFSSYLLISHLTASSCDADMHRPGRAELPHPVPQSNGFATRKNERYGAEPAGKIDP